jgi:hypothetical protein
MKLLNAPIWRKGISFFLAVLIIVFTTGCNYFKVREYQPEELPSLTELGKTVNYFVLNQGSQQYRLTKLSVDKEFLYATADTLTKTAYYSPERVEESKRYKVGVEASIIHEVHVFLKGIPSSYFQPGEEIRIPLILVDRVDVIDPDNGRTVASYLGTALGVAAGAFVIFMILVLIFKESCPYVYANTGEVFVMEGEIYSGAIFRGLERLDYLPLPNIRPVEDAYQIRIANELKEHQHTNLANLMVVNHPEGTQLWMDQEGRPHLVTNPIPPSSAFSEMGEDLSGQVAATDRSVFFFDEEEADTNRLYLHFPKPENVENATLLLNLKNTLWGDYVYGEFSRKMGHFYTSWVQMQNRKSAIEVKQRMDQMGFPMRVLLETDEGWKPVQTLSLIGPLSNRDLAVSVDLSRVSGEEIRLRLESSFMFWEVDYAAMDLTPAKPLEVIELKPVKAFGTAESNARASLTEDDGLYLDQWETGDVTEVHFEAPPIPEGYVQSCFLHSKGYYNHVRTFSHTPEYAELFKFREPGYFDDFSKALFREAIGEESLVTYQ